MNHLLAGKSEAVASISNSLSIVMILSSLLVACSRANESSFPATQQEQTVTLTVSAAASLTDAIANIEQLYQQQNPKVSITSNLASSGSLQRQIEQGAPVDVFISAASDKMDALQEQGLLLEDSHKDILENQLVLIVPKSDTSISEFQDLTGANVQKISIGEPTSVPAGTFAVST